MSLEKQSTFNILKIALVFGFGFLNEILRIAKFGFAIFWSEPVCFDALMSFFGGLFSLILAFLLGGILWLVREKIFQNYLFNWAATQVFPSKFIPFMSYFFAVGMVLQVAFFLRLVL